MAVVHKFSNTEAVSILGLLQSNSRFIVPKFQRNYSWNKDRVAMLWSDLLDNFTIYKRATEPTHDAEYLLGPIVLVDGERKSEYFVIDGQQRLSTLTMLFCVARDIIYEHRDASQNTEPRGIEKIKTMIENTHMEKHTSWKLELNDTDKALFREIQSYEDHERPQIERIEQRVTKTKSEKNLRNNYMFLYETIMDALLVDFDDTKSASDIKKNTTEQEQRTLRQKNIYTLNFFLTCVQECNYVVKVMVKDDNTAFQIFETLNERGQALSKSNLIKNHILNQVDNKNDKQQKLSGKWNKIFDDMIGQGQRDDDFIMESLRSRYPNNKTKITIKNLYKIIKERITNEETCEQYIAGLDDDAEFLSKLNDPASYDHIETRDDVYALKLLSAKSIRTPILAAHREWGMNKDYEILIKFLVKFFFKFRIIRKEHPGSVEKVVLDTTQMILDGRSLKDILTEIKKNDDQEDFEYDFKKFMAEPGKHVAKYTLQQITIHRNTPKDEVSPIDNLTLEYILPQKSDKWNKRDFLEGSDEQMDDYIKRLGNLTILKDAVNAEIKNEPFKTKKENGYGDSKLDINKDICSKDDWTKSSIEEREAEFAEYAKEIWRLDHD